MSTTISNILAGYRGLYARVAERAGVDASYVSRIADGTRKNEWVENLLVEEIRNLHSATENFLSERSSSG